MAVDVRHDAALVVLSILIAIFASYTALDLGSRLKASRGWPCYAWLAAASTAMGGGIWSMHFVAMLAFSDGMPVTYGLGLTLLSLAVAILAPAVGFLVVGRQSVGSGRVVTSGLFMGLGIVGMHYTGMAAMRMNADIHYDKRLVAVSVLIAVGAATVGLWFAFRRLGFWERVAAAVAMGLAIAGMHYTGMAAATFSMQHGVGDGLGHEGLDRTRLALAVAAATFLILFIALVAAMFDRRFALLAEREATALRRAKEFSDLLLRNAGEGIVAYDTALRCTLWNPATETMTGIPAVEALGRLVFELLRDLEGTPAEQALRGALEGRLGVSHGVPYSVPRTGREGCYDASFAPLRDADGKIVGGIAFIQDTTERHRVEEALRQSQKMEAVGQLTSGIAHDFNNLLTSVLGNLELAERRVADEGTRKLLRAAVRSAERGARLTAQLLAFSRRQRLAPSPIDLPGLVQGMDEMFRRTLGTIIEVRTSFPDDLWPVLADSNQLELAILNLAINARDAMPDGGLLTLEARNAASAGMPDLAAGEYVVLSIADSGCGMPEAVLARAFEPFFTTKEPGKGSGLGLSMVHGFAKQSGGAVRIDSRLGEGTTVELFLPRSTGSSAEAPAQLDTEGDREDAAGGGARVLVVDDEGDVRDVVVAQLEALGYAVVEAADGRGALDALDSGEAVDLILVDYAMPGMTGVELAHAVAASRPWLPLLLVTGYAEAEALGGDAARWPMLKKPFRAAELASAVEGALRSARASAPLRVGSTGYRRRSAPQPGKRASLGQ